MAITSLDEPSRRLRQLTRLNQLLDAIVPTNKFYTTKFAAKKTKLAEIESLSDLPFTTKQELVNDDDSAGFARNLTFPVDAYSRFHRTSGTSGRPMIVLDTPNDWRWWMEAWQYVLDSAKVSTADRVLMAFSFGPFIGFWSAFDAAVERGAMVAPTGAMSSAARLELIHSIDATVVFCTPSYAIHLAQLAKDSQIDLTGSQVSRIVVAGEPGGSIPAIKSKIESAWNADVIDHCGASEVGPWGVAAPDGSGIFVNEAEFIPEFLPVGSDDAMLHPETPSRNTSLDDVAPVYELVLTCLGRAGSPVIRYRTGDLVRPVWDHGHRCQFVKLDGGVLGRSDDMMIIRGVNVFPSSVDQIVRAFDGIAEYRMTAFKAGAMDQLQVEIEIASDSQTSDSQTTNSQASDLVTKIHQAFETRLGFRVDVQPVENGTLPRFEAKGKRFIDNRQ